MGTSDKTSLQQWVNRRFGVFLIFFVLADLLPKKFLRVWPGMWPWIATFCLRLNGLISGSSPPGPPCTKKRGVIVSSDSSDV
jgi:hypothetical protein